MAGDTTKVNQPLFRDITADEDEPEITEMESLCVNCEKQGMTRLFLTKIPFFRDVIVSSFSCDHCGFRNAELQSASKIQDEGVIYSVNIQTAQDLNRQIVLSDSAVLRIPVLEFESPSKKGMLTTVEGVISQTIDDLSQAQPLRKIQAPEVAEKIERFLDKMRGLLLLTEPFEIVLNDPAGNSFMENPHAPAADPEMKVVHYTRTRQQDIDLCIITEDADQTTEGGGGGGTTDDEREEEEVLGTKDKDFNTQNEVLTFRINCPSCNSPCETNMKLVNIPYFKEVVIMATCCEACGHRDNEVKGGGGIEPKGRKISLLITNERDMTRDVLKSETAYVAIPELEFQTDMSTLGGKFTTVEGLLEDFKTQLKEVNPFMSGDSSLPAMRQKLQTFCEKLEQIQTGRLKDVHLVLDDPAGNSYVQSLTAPDPDPQLQVEDYVRTFQQNEDLGLNDMKTENYEQS